MPSICSYCPTEPKLWVPNGEVGAPRSILVMRASATGTKMTNAKAAADGRTTLRTRFAKTVSGFEVHGGNGNAVPCIRILPGVFRVSLIFKRLVPWVPIGLIHHAPEALDLCRVADGKPGNLRKRAQRPLKLHPARRIVVGVVRSNDPFRRDTL